MKGATLPPRLFRYLLGSMKPIVSTIEVCRMRFRAVPVVESDVVGVER